MWNTDHWDPDPKVMRNTTIPPSLRSWSDMVSNNSTGSISRIPLNHLTKDLPKEHYLFKLGMCKIYPIHLKQAPTPVCRYNVSICTLDHDNPDVQHCANHVEEFLLCSFQEEGPEHGIIKHLFSVGIDHTKLLMLLAFRG